MFLNQMQTAFIAAAHRSYDNGTRNGGKWVDKVVRVAERQVIQGEAKPSIKLSFRTAQKLKAEGVIQ